MTTLWVTMYLNMFGMLAGFVIYLLSEKTGEGIGLILISGFWVLYFAIRIGTKEIIEALSDG
jgi:hypothetical protein